MSDMRSFDNRPIGVFDSGVGGLTVAKSICRHLPDEDIIYFGDTARVPYGNKSKATIIRFSHEIMSFMLKKKVKMVVVACNTASSLSLTSLKKTYPVPVVGVITPGVKEAARVTKTGRIGVIGTSSTISSGAYKKAMKKVSASSKLYSECCPLFVPLVENRFLNDKITREVANKYLKPLKNKNIDTLILGCTHYPILKSVIGKVMKGVKLVDSSSAVAKEVKDILLKDGIAASPNRKRGGNLQCFVSDDIQQFRKVSKIFLKKDINIKRAVL